MPRLVLRLLPVKPVDGDTFKDYLTGLEIKLTDRSFADPAGKDPGHVLGTAKYIAEGDVNATIVQHLDPSVPGVFRAPVATAVVELASPLPFSEYDSVDLAFVMTRKVGANPAQTIQVKEINFNVDVRGGPAPADNDPTTYAALGPTATYLFLPKPLVGLAPGIAFVDIAADGSPPPFAAVLNAMTTVLAADPGAGAPSLAELTPAQCRHLAWEIISNRTLDPLPTPSASLEKLYSGGDETARQRFEADLVTFHAVHSTKADVLAKFAYSVAAGTECRARTQQATQVGLTVPVFPGIVPASGAAPVASVVVSQ